MKKKSHKKSAFFSLRSLLAFAIGLAGLALALLAVTGLTSRSADAQAGPAYSGPAVDHRPVQAVRSRPLREVKPTHPSRAGRHDHPEPVRPTPPSESGGPDGPMQTTAGASLSAPTA